MTPPSALDSTDALAHALHYAALGWQVTPIRPGSKVPLLEGWTTVEVSEGEITEWWGTGSYGIGLVCGPRSGIWALDVDPADGGDETLAALEAANGALPPTVEAMTPRGGRHLLFRWPADGRVVPTNAGQLGPGLDLRGQGGQIVVAPSTHPETGGRYEWELSSRPGEVPVAEAPAWLLELVCVAPPEPLPEGQVSWGGDMRYAMDRLNATSSNEDVARLLAAHGWHSPTTDRHGRIYLRHESNGPRDHPGVSIGFYGPGTVHCFTASTALEDGKTYRPFDLYAELDHGGDRTAADEALVERGYGLPTYIDATAMDAYVAGERARAAAVRAVTQAGGGDGLFRRWTMAELSEADLTLRWMVRSFLIDPTYGQIAGELKTLKSYLATLLMASVASGERFLGRFEVERPGPVLTYVGEGGLVPFTRRMGRVASALGVPLRSLDVHPTFDVSPVQSDRFAQSLERDFDEVNPSLFLIDPLYTYHGTTTSASNLHEEGALLSALSAPAMARGTSLMIVNHFNQTGSGSGLKRITMAGSGEWADSWVLLSHRDVPRVAEGRFFLSLDVGSRQWGGHQWDLDLSIGRLDAETGTHDGEITWELSAPGYKGNLREAMAEAYLTVDRERGLNDGEMVEALGGTSTVNESEVRQMRLAMGGEVTMTNAGTHRSARWTLRYWPDDEETT